MRGDRNLALAHVRKLAAHFTNQASRRIGQDHWPNPSRKRRVGGLTGAADSRVR